MFALTTLQVENFEESLEFYHKKLNLPIICKFSTADGMNIAMLGEENNVHLEIIGTGKVPEHPDNGISVGFRIENVEAFIESLGVEAIGPVCPNPKTKFYFIHDPNGYRIQLLEVNI